MWQVQPITPRFNSGKGISDDANTRLRYYRVHTSSTVDAICMDHGLAEQFGIGICNVVARFLGDQSSGDLPN